MARTKAANRHLKPDLKYNSVKVTKLINYVMRKGKKKLAFSIVYDSFRRIGAQTQAEPLDIFEKALAQITPRVEVRSKRMGGANIQIPIEVSSRRQLQLALRWLVNAAKERKEQGMILCLANEIIDASNGEGAAYKKKRDTHKAAQSHKTYAHLR